MEVLRRCPLAIAQQLVHSAIAVSTAVMGRVTRTMPVALLLRNDPKRKKSNFRSPAVWLPAHDLFWANLRVQLHLPPLDLAWNPVQKGMQRLQVFKSRFGLVVWCFCWAGKQKDHPFDSASALLSLQTLWFMDTVVVTLPLTVNETLKWLPQLPILMQRSLWWCQHSNPLPLVVTV